MAIEGEPSIDSLRAALGRIQLWLDLHPEVVNVASQIGSHPDFQSEGWVYRMYAMDRRDMEAVLNVARKALEEENDE